MKASRKTQRRRGRGKSSSEKSSFYMTEKEWYQLLAARVRYQATKGNSEESPPDVWCGTGRPVLGKGGYQSRCGSRLRTSNGVAGSRRSAPAKPSSGEKERTFSDRIRIDLFEWSKKYGQSTMGHQSFGLMHLVRMRSNSLTQEAVTSGESVQPESSSLAGSSSASSKVEKDENDSFETDSTNSFDAEVERRKQQEREEELRSLREQLDEQRSKFERVEAKNEQISSQLEAQRAELEDKLNTLTAKVSNMSLSHSNNINEVHVLDATDAHALAKKEAKDFALETEDEQVSAPTCGEEAEAQGTTLATRETPTLAWERVIDPESGLAYYYDSNTGESQWEPPQAVVEHSASKLQGWFKKVCKASFEQVQHEEINEEDLGVNHEKSTGMPASDDAQDVASSYPTETEGSAGAPAETEAQVTESNTTSENGVSSPATDAETPAEEIIQPLYDSEEWSKVKDGDGSTYYYNTATGDSQWEVPKSIGHKAAIRIQAVMRGRLARESILTMMAYNYLERQKAAVKIQKALRGWTTRKSLLKQLESDSAVEIQRLVRGYLCRKKAKALREKTVMYTSPDVQVNPDWEECIDPISGSLYYVNNDTGEISWNSPQPKTDSVDKMFDVQLEDVSGRTGSDIDFEDKTSSNDNPLQDLFAELEVEDSSFEHDIKSSSLEKDSGMQSPGEETTYELADEDIDAMFEIAAEVSNELDDVSEENEDTLAPLTPSGILNRRGKKLSLQVKTVSETSDDIEGRSLHWSNGASGLATPTGKKVGEWVEKIDAETGEVYYFNCATEECRWDAPKDFMRRAGVTQGHNKETWDAIHSPAGVLLFWYNWSTGKSECEEPAQQRSHLGSISEESTGELNGISMGSSKTEESKGKRARFTLHATSKSQGSLQSQRLWMVLYHNARIIETCKDWHLMEDPASKARYYSNSSSGSFEWEIPEEWVADEAHSFVDQSNSEPEALTFEGVANASVVGLRWKSSTHVTRSWSSVASPRGKCLFEFNWESGEVRKSLNTSAEQVMPSRLHVLNDYPNENQEMGSGDYVLWTIVLERSVVTKKSEGVEERLDELSGEIFVIEKKDFREEHFKWCDKRTSVVGNGWIKIESSNEEATYWYNSVTGVSSSSNPNQG